MDDLLYEPESVRRFVGLRLTDPLPDGSTIPHFRHLLEQHGMGQRLLRGFTTICKTGMLRLRERMGSVLLVRPPAERSPYKGDILQAGH